MPTLRILYILSMARGGSTLLGNILGQAEGFVHVGELNRLWFRLARSPSSCGCGDDLETCELWAKVIGRLECDHTYPGRSWLNETQLAHQGIRGLVRQQLRPPAPVYPETVRRLYELVADECDGAVIVDSSKRPGYASLLAGLPGVDVRFVHLVRDPRGTAASRTRRSRGRRSDVRRARSLVADSARWVVGNRVAESIAESRPSISMSYEELAADPSRTADRALALFDTDATVAPVFDGSVVHLQPTHTVWGNRSRFATGAVEIVDDRRWLTELAPWERRLAAGLPHPWLSRYGY